MNRGDLLEALEKLYLELTERLPRFEGNACGSCRACCTTGMASHEVSELEMELIRVREGEERADDFRSFLRRETNEDGHHRFGYCPNYDLDRQGCGIYEVRPFSCRVFGHYRKVSTSFPVDCVFRGKAADFEMSDYYAIVPLADRMRWLTREMQLYLPAAKASMGPVDTELLNSADPIDRSIRHKAEGNLEAALEELLIAREHNQSSYLDYSMALLYSIQNRHQEAVDSFHAAAAAAPRADFFAMAAHHSLALGLAQEAEVDLLRALDLDSRCAIALGMLAFLRLTDKRVDEGAAYLERAVREDPSNGFFHLKLGLAWIELGREPEGLTEIVTAAGFASTRAQAERILAAIKV